MGHMLRLVLEAENIFETGRPIVHFTSTAREQIMDVRNGKMKYDEVVALIREKTSVLSEKFRRSTLPDQVDCARVEVAYDEAMRTHGKRDE